MPSRSLPLFSPGRSIIASFIVVIVIGTLLLALPLAQRTPISFFDCFFTATSATCVTGLLTVPLAAFSTFGHFIILALMQLGGLGIITISVFFVSLFAEVGLATQQIAEQALEISTWKDTRRLVGFIITLTVTMELLGTLFIYASLPTKGLHSFFFALFHAISSFCNAGINIFTPEAMIHNSVLPFTTNIPFLVTTAILILVGGLGFITWYELIRYVKSVRLKRRIHFSLHSKLVFIMSSALIATTAFALWMLEGSTFGGLSVSEKIINIIFNAISYRSTGFTTISMGVIDAAMLFLMMIIAFIGSSPGSAGSGIKTTTFALFLASVKAVILGRTVVEIKGRRIPNEQIFKAMAVLSLALGWIAFVTFCLLATHTHMPFLDILFEAVSSFANLGLSLGVTPYFSAFGKILLIASMLVGRIGAITFLIALKKRRETREFSYPEERVIIG